MSDPGFEQYMQAARLMVDDAIAKYHAAPEGDEAAGLAVESAAMDVVYAVKAALDARARQEVGRG